MTLYINCCVRKESRTNRLAKVVLQKLGKDYTELKLYEENLRPLDLEKLNRRTELIERGDFKTILKTSTSQVSSPLITKMGCRSAYARRITSTTSPPPAVPTTRPTATAISRASQKSSSAFRKRI